MSLLLIPTGIITWHRLKGTQSSFKADAIFTKKGNVYILLKWVISTLSFKTWFYIVQNTELLKTFEGISDIWLLNIFSDFLKLSTFT